jgi:hypothetical protein
MDDNHLTIDDGLTGNIKGAAIVDKRLVQSKPLRVKTLRLPLST